MKTIRMERTFYYRPHPVAVIQYKAGQKYERVPEAAVAEILRAKAGSIVTAIISPNA